MPIKRLHTFFSKASNREQFNSTKGNVIHITEPRHRDRHLCSRLNVHLCLVNLEGHFTLLMTSMCDSRYKYKHIEVVIMEIIYCLGIKTCSSLCDNNTQFIFEGNIS